MEDEIIEVNNAKYSLRKILGEAGWETYNKTSDKVRSLTKLIVRIDLSKMEIAFAKLNQKI